MKFLIAIFLIVLACAAFARDPSQVSAFKRTHPCPGGPDKGSIHRCRGYVVDHIKPLDCGGADRPYNMQWQTVRAGKLKDRWERNGPSCKHRTHGVRHAQ